LNRDALTSKTIDEAIARSTPDGRAYGYSINIGSASELRVVNLEVSPDVYAVWEVDVGNYSHFNMYKNLQVSQLQDTSTIHRQRRVYAMAAPQGEDDIIDILGDTADAQWPIYRNGNPPDDAVTCATGLFDFRRSLAWLWIANPKTSAPISQFQIK
jgi:hypothetical protein